MLKLTARRLTADEQRALVTAKLAWVLSHCGPTKVILFGSAARREMTEASDIDLILLFPDDGRLRQAQKHLARQVRYEDWPHDLLYFTERGFRQAVDKGGGAAWLADREGEILFPAIGGSA